MLLPGNTITIYSSYFPQDINHQIEELPIFGVGVLYDKFSMLQEEKLKRIIIKSKKL